MKKSPNSPIGAAAENAQTEEALLLSEAILRSVYRVAPVGISIMIDRVFKNVNKYWCDKYGYSEESIIGKSTRITYESDEEWNRVGQELYAQLQERGEASVESRLVCGDGSIRNVLLTIAPIRQDDLSAGVVAITHDITERKLSDMELEKYSKKLEDMVQTRTSEMREAKEELEAIFEAATSGIVLIKDRVIVHCNRRMDEMFGYAHGEMIGLTTRIWYNDETTYDAIGVETAASLSSGTVFVREQQLIRKDGSFFWGRMTAQASDKQDLSKGLVGIIADITAEKENEESLKKALDHAEESDRMKSAFLATMSHELRTPLNSIIGFTGILLQELAGPLNEEQHKQLDMVRKSSRHLLELINDVLDISKIEAGQLRVQREPFDLRTSIAKVVGIVKPLAENKGLALSVEIAPEIGFLVSDSRRVEQALLNLLNNAIKFTERGVVTLTVEIVQGGVSISVADTGIGIKPEDLGKLFQPFRQIDSGLSRQHEGTGLGLAICRRLAELLGGEIRVASECGKGSIFTFTLPMKGVDQ